VTNQVHPNRIVANWTHLKEQQQYNYTKKKQLK
jgi:actin-related protein